MGSSTDSSTLEQSLATWRKTRDPAMADEIDRLTEAALASFRPPKAAKAEAFDAAWCELARTTKDAVAVGWLASTLVTKWPACHSMETSPDVTYERRLDLLTAHGDDPRIAKALVEVLKKEPFGGTADWAERTYEPTLKRIAQLRDARQVEALERICAAPRTRTAGVRAYFEKALPKVIKTLRARAPSAPSATKAKAHPRENADALLAAIARDPASDEARAVYADCLSESGDPRGEFITIQLLVEQGRASEAQVKRARALLKQHADAWLGPLRPMFLNTDFRRGFLSAATLRPSWSGSEKAWNEARTSPLLGSLEELRQGKCNTKLFESFLKAPAMTGLRRVEARQPSTLAVLAGRKLDHVEAPTALVLEAHDALDALHLQSVGIDFAERERPERAELQSLIRRFDASLPATLRGIALRVQGSLPMHDVEVLDAISQLWKRKPLAWLAVQIHDTFIDVRYLETYTAGEERLHVLARLADYDGAWDEFYEERLPALKKRTGSFTVTVNHAPTEAQRKALGVEVSVRPGSDVASDLTSFRYA